MSGVKSFENYVRESLARLEQEGAKALPDLRQMKRGKDVNEINEHLSELKQLKNPIEEMIRFLENYKSKITETELSMYELLGGVVNREKTGRSFQGVNGDSGCYSADSRLLSTESGLITQETGNDVLAREDDVTSTSRIVTSIHTEPTQHEDTSNFDKMGDDSAC